ncbi:hypothetical protein INR76_00110 [Marixanthomonas sp. SCSIO 43207]|uniref:hypothetical protein n=1 Tax=Marixanthomonas sp. SCSIO 43207 TaxID=2779360 RepID=UPI001CA8BEE3|nr:hypothetical protein [Marixanthomonas sp. SCSIO 43207]UAB81198.1 hypothetical protein INR76_00110 [Marixanthomonas sp. SCSIO 43207]
MKTKNLFWTKEELKIYILLLCAQVDKKVAEEEVSLIKSQTTSATFNTMYKEFLQDDERKSFEKIQDALEHHDYSSKELAVLKKEIQNVFMSDKTIHMKERNLGWILDNILY